MAEQVKVSPKITHFEWGKLEIEGYAEPFKDAKLYPGGACEWDWGKTGTRHDPGIQPADVEEVLDHGAAVVILSKGVHERLKTCAETLELLKEREIVVEVLQTELAIKRYNELAGSQQVGALIHSTC